MLNAKKEILYVGGGTPNGTDTRLAALNPAWKLAIANSGQSALLELKARQFDVVITNDELTDMDGFRFLDVVQQNHPRMHRVVLADLHNPKTAVKTVGIAHQCVPKDSDVAVLKRALERIFNLGLWLSNPAVRDLLGRMPLVPSPPELYLEISRALRDPSISLDAIADHAEQDPGISAKLLQLANSAALGLRQKVVNVGQAIDYLGLQMTRALVLLAHTFAYCDRSKESKGRTDRLWQHSVQVAALARRLAREEGCTVEEVDVSFLAGLLHDIGELLLMVNLPKEYNAVVADAAEANIPLWQAELNYFQATHAELGAELMAIWNLPLAVVEALALHHHPTTLLTGGFNALTAVHVADVLEQELTRQNDEHSSIDLQYLANLGLETHLDQWRVACADELHREEL